jgi:hypothetical protein
MGPHDICAILRWRETTGNGADYYKLGRPKNNTYASASSISKPLRLSLLLWIGFLNDTPFERYSSNNVSGSSTDMYASHRAHS